MEVFRTLYHNPNKDKELLLFRFLNDYMGSLDVKEVLDIVLNDPLKENFRKVLINTEFKRVFKTFDSKNGNPGLNKVIKYLEKYLEEGLNEDNFNKVKSIVNNFADYKLN